MNQEFQICILAGGKKTGCWLLFSAVFYQRKSNTDQLQK
jgi:hypothetical protein